MKNYFFSYQGWGTCYTVMAESRKKAIEVVLAHIKEEATKGHELNKKYNIVERLDYIETPKQLLKDYIISEFEPNQVIETEYS